METKFTEQESLKVINEMIAQAKNNFQKGSVNTAIFWGYLTAALSIANFILLQLFANSGWAYNVWWLILPGWLVYALMQRKIDRSAAVKTPIDKIIIMFWISFGISVAILQIVFWTFSFQENIQFVYLVPIIMILCGTVQFGTAAAYRYRSYYWGSVIFWISAILSILVAKWTGKVDYQLIVLACSAIVGFVIPNHILNKKAESNV
jgi:hypothetical protein